MPALTKVIDVYTFQWMASLTRHRQAQVQPPAEPVVLDGLGFLALGDATPLYHRIQLALADQIVSGRWAHGAELPPENDLCAHFGVSRGTLRRALAHLAMHGLITRHQGRGTFVADTKFEGRVFASYAAYRAGAVSHDSWQVLKCEPRPAPADVRRLLDLKSAEPIYDLRRIQFMRGVPITLTTSYLPASLVPGLERQDLLTESLYVLLERVYGLVFLRAEETIEPVAAASDLAVQLRLKVGTPIFRIERSSYVHGDRVRELRRSFMRGDRYKLRIDLR